MNAEVNRRLLDPTNGLDRRFRMHHDGITFKQRAKRNRSKDQMNTFNSTQQAQDTFNFILDRLHVLFQDIVVLTEEQKNALYANASVTPNLGKAALAVHRGRRVIFGADDVDTKSYFIAAENGEWVVTMIRALNGVTTVYYDGITETAFDLTFGGI